MRSLAVLMLVGCTCGPSTPGDVPRGLDEGPIADSELEVSADVPHARPRWELEAISSEPCEPWDAIALEPSALPADPTPRVLWVWNAGADPAFVEGLGRARLPFQFLLQPVIAPDGSLRLFGPDQSSITALSRDGEFLWLAGPGVRSIEEGFYGHPMVDPEGTTWMVSRGSTLGVPGATPIPVLHRYADGAYRSTMPLPDLRPSVGHGFPHLSVGSTGQLLVTEVGLSTCRGLRAEWRGRGLIPSIRMRSGELLSVFGGGWLVDRTGAHRPSELALPPEVDTARSDYDYFGVRPYTEELFDLSLISAPAAPPRPPPRRWLGRSGDFVELDIARWPVVSPTGPRSMWAATEAANPEFRRLSYIVDGRVESATEFRGGLYFPTDDGSLLILDIPSAAPVALVRLMTDGTIAWRVPLVNSDGTPFAGSDTPPTVDRRGVFYAASGNAVIAVQTDTLPPPDGTCFLDGCNARRDFAMYYPTE